MAEEDLEDLPLPVDTKKSRLRKTDPPPVSDFDPDAVESVDEKVLAFRRDWPEGLIRTTVTVTDDFDGRTYHARARVIRVAGGYVASTGHATRTQGQGEWPYSDRAQETAESVAISRALRFLGYTGANHEEPTDEA